MDLRELPREAFVRHPWEVARSRFFREVIAAHGLNEQPIAVLDVGAGDGYFARMLCSELAAGSQVVCYDPNYSDDVVSAVESQDNSIRFSREQPAGLFDLLLLLDVVEHVGDDASFLSGLVGSHLRPGGMALVAAPAWNALYTRHDRLLGHYRRYRPAALRALLQGAGLRIVFSGGLFHSLLLARAATKAHECLCGLRSEPSLDVPEAFVDTELGHWHGGPALTALVAGALRIDNRFSHLCAYTGLQVPGLSTWALGTKR